MEQCDIAIVGAGMVGAATACLLAAEASVRVIETRLPEPYAPGQPLDLRVSAISQASVALLTRAGAWQYLQQMRLCPYRRLETWGAGRFRHPLRRRRSGAAPARLHHREPAGAARPAQEDGGFPDHPDPHPGGGESLRQSAEGPC